MRRLFLLLAMAVSPICTAHAGEVDVVKVSAKKAQNGTWRFNVTLRHDDSGWEHYANKWEVVAPDGTVLATRVLLHPHVAEQPFTRSKSRIRIPDGVSKVIVRAGVLDTRGDHVSGGAEITVSLD